MTTTIKTTYTLLQEGTNPLAALYRAYVDSSESPTKLKIVHSIAYNAIQAVAHLFAALFQRAWHLLQCQNIKASHWAEAKILLKFTSIGLKALWNREAAMSSLRYLETIACLKSYCRQPIAKAIEMMPLYWQLSPEQQQTFISYLVTKLPKIYDDAFLFDIVCHARSHHKQQYKELVSGLAVRGKIVIVAPQDEVWLMKKESLLAACPEILKSEQFDPSFSVCQQNHFKDGLQLKESTSLILLKQIQQVFECGIVDTLPLINNLKFLILVKNATNKQIQKFFTVSCNYWVLKLLNGSRKFVVEEINLLFQCNFPKLNAALYLYLLTHSSYESLIKIEDRIASNQNAILNLLFDESIEKMQLNRAFIFLRLLALSLRHIQSNSNTENGIALCQQGNQYAHLLQCKQEQVKSVVAECTEVWNQFPLEKHLDIGLALLQLFPKDTEGKPLLPFVSQIAHTASKIFMRAKEIPPGCEEIMIQTIHRIPLMLKQKKNIAGVKLCFNVLEEAIKRSCNRLRQACMQKIIDGQMYLEEISPQQRRLFADTLKEYTRLSASDLQANKEEALSLFSFATRFSEHKDLCINHLKSNKSYQIAVQHFVCASSSDELKELHRVLQN